MTTHTDLLRDCIWNNLVLMRLEHEEHRIGFTWETVLFAVTRAGLLEPSHQAQLENAIESWNEPGIRVNWTGERDGAERSIYYVITVDLARLQPNRRSSKVP